MNRAERRRQKKLATKTSGNTGRSSSQRIQETVNRAIQYHTEGALQKAEVIYHQVLDMQPNHFDAMHLLGVIAHQVGNNEKAVDLIGRALIIRPDNAEAHNNHGQALCKIHKLDEAATSYRKALAIHPNYSKAYYNLGNLQIELSYLDEAIVNYRKALEIDSNNSEIHFNLGNALKGQNNIDEAIKSFQEALSIQPLFIEAYNNLGMSLHALERYDEAVEIYQMAISINPDYAEAHNNLGVSLQKLGKLEEAVQSFKKTIKLHPMLASAYNNIGIILQQLNKPEEAVEFYYKALSINPDQAEIHNDLGNALYQCKKPEEAITSYLKAISIKPESAEMHYNIGNAYLKLNELGSAIENYHKALELDPDQIKASSNLLVIKCYLDDHHPVELRDEIRHYQSLAANSAPRKSYSNSPDVSRRLRVGFISGDLYSHPIGYFLVGPLTYWNRNEKDLFVYATSDNDDVVTSKLKALVPNWNWVSQYTDDQLNELIIADEIDILIDLSGHTENNRLPIFSKKPAPVQVTWIGSNVTTGVDAIDYILCDDWTLPQEEESHFVEKPWRLPNTWLCFSPPDYDIDAGPLPAIKNSRITFGCFNNLMKLNSTVIKVWSDILLAIPGSRLFLKTTLLDNIHVREKILSSFEMNGVKRNRLLLEGHSERKDLLASYQKVDIALDPFPFPGGISSMEAMWMGVPVLSLRGDKFVSHVAESTLHNIGLPNWIADNPEDVITKAKGFTSDLAVLSELRKSLRSRLLRSPLCDSEVFAQNLNNAFKEMWRIWCDQANRESNNA